MDATDVDNPHSPGLTSNAPLTDTGAALRLGLKVATLRAWRHQRRGPVFVQLGRAIRYLLLAAGVNSTVVADENLTVGSGIYRARQIRQGFAEWPCFGVMKYAELRKARIFRSAELATLRSAFARRRARSPAQPKLARMSGERRLARRTGRCPQLAGA